MYAFLKVDIKNAFNCLDRNAFLAASQLHLPQYHFFVAHGNPSFLMCEENVLLSQIGSQQGDPLGPLSYCLSTLNSHRDLLSHFKESYLNDDAVCSPLAVVLHDFVPLKKDLGNSELVINVNKCEVFLYGGFKR